MKTSLRFLLFIVFLASCAPAPIPTPTQVEVTRVVLQTVVVTQIVDHVITATPEPPTPTPFVTPTPIYAKWNTNQVVAAFKAAGLEAEKPGPMTREDYGMAPMVAIEATHFFIPSVCADCGGRIFAFDDPSNLRATKAYYDALGTGSAALFSYTLVKDNILVQINGDLPKTKADLYKAALENLK